METDEYLSVNNARSIEGKPEKHVRRDDVCTQRKMLLRGTILRGKLSDMISLEDMMCLLERDKFRVN